MKKLIKKLIYKKGKREKYSEPTLDRNIDLFIDKYGFTYEEVINIVKRAPTVFTLSTKNLDNKLTYIIEKYGKKLVVDNPSILSYKLDTLEHKIEMYAKYSGLSKEEVEEIVKKYPRILSYSLDRFLEVSSLIASYLKIDEQEARKYVIKNPRILTRSYEKIKYVLEKYGENVLRNPSRFLKV